MARRALFTGLVVDEAGQPVAVTYVGDTAFYVVDDAGFWRHISSEEIDRQVLKRLQEQVLANRDLAVAGMLQYLGQDDLFTKAAVEASIARMDEATDQLLQTGLPEEALAGLGMVGFRIVIDVHGEVVKVQMPGAAAPDDESL